MEYLDSAQLVTGLINAHAIARCIQVIAEVGVADALHDQPKSAAELADHCGLNADALNRMLRLLSAYGVFALQEDGWVHTRASHLLRSDHSHSLRPFARMVGMPVMWNGFTEFEAAARTGRPAISWADLVQYFSEHLEEASLFDQAMISRAANIIPAVIEAYDFTQFQVIADIGGGRGQLLEQILASTPSASGILFDLPHVVEAISLESPRLQVLSGDFFSTSLPVADAYILMEVIHDWGDEDAAKILAAVRRATTNTRLLIVESLLGDQPGPHLGKTLDIVMLANTGGRERTASEYKRLLNAAGFELEQIIPTASQHSIVEVRAI